MNNPLVPIAIAFFSFVAIVLLVPAWLRHRRRNAALRLIADMARSGQPLDGASIEQLLAQRQLPVGKWYAILNLVLGVAALSIGTALLLSAQLLGRGMGMSAAQQSGMMIAALMNISIGTGLAGLGLAGQRFFTGARRCIAQWDFAAVLGLVCLFLGIAGLSISTGLTLAARLYVLELSGERAAAEMLMGALVNACSGVGFTVVSTILLRSVVHRQSIP